jgi:hypothetical protein
MAKSAHDLVVAIGELVHAVSDLFAAKSIEAIIKLVLDLKQESITDVVRKAFSELSEQTDHLGAWLRELREPLSQVGAIDGLLGLLGPLLQGVERLLQAGDQELGKLGIGNVQGMLEPFQKVAHAGGGLLKSGQNLIEGLPSYADVEKLAGELAELGKTFAKHQKMLDGSGQTAELQGGSHG